MLKTAALLFALFLAAVSPALAVDEADRTAIRGLIERQLDAFKRDDGAAAYALAAPSIQRIFPSQEGFMGMVRQGYAPVYRPRSTIFGELTDTPHGPVQSVLIQDADGEDWMALYSLERQPDGSWLIGGCALVRKPGQAV